MAKNVDTLAMMRTARRQYPAHGPAVPPGLHGSLVNEMAAQQPLQATAPHLSQWLDSQSMALSCTNVNQSLTPQPRTPEKRWLPDATALDGEWVVWESGRLAFGRLQGRLRRGAGAVEASTTWPYRRRRTALEDLFAERRLSAPWAGGRPSTYAWS